ncbi:hypothetical protein SEVIR_7G239300v4 [Setaria viridis]|uniref:Uncharacterized protein n=1 Tax=Setaria viridis TaxID=4556 RepID=A0A4U6TXP7_SETVI|nr:uncharacterized protein LOC117862748 isoform X2 [Setaria viridis]TKW06384.1 hypothetical protein SEVIR_7G239300v2 [Setaria viridis]
MVEEMVYKTPELKDRLHFPRGRHNLHHVVPIRSSFHRGRHMKIACRKQSTDYAQFYLRMKKRLPSSTQAASPDCSAAGSARIRGELQMALLEKALQAGGRSVLEGQIPEYSSNEGFPLMKMLSRPPFLVNFVGSPVHQPEHSSKDTSQSPAAVASQETN